ncbi:hypothetical protein VY88_14195 [Azospirillum thiophilum]|nr:hypothetical protein VY88_14195 [Azospirillum thiophilum]
MFIRPFLKISLKIIGGLCMVTFVALLIIGGMSDGENKLPAWLPFIYLAISFAAFLAGWFYDNLLLKLNPESNILILDR